MKKIVLVFSLWTASLPLFAQTPVAVAEFTWVADANGTLSCQESVRKASPLERNSAEITRSLKVIESTLSSAGGDGHLNIILRATDQLKANTTAQESFIKAAEAWEQIILTPVTLVIDVDYGPNRFGTPYSSANIIGSTSSAIYAATNEMNGAGNEINFSDYGTRLTETHEGFGTLYYNLPSPIISDIGTISFPIATRPNLQALGYFSAVTSEVTPFGQTPNIGFNSAFTFDFDQSDGIGNGLTDFQGVTIHEIGHALGFVSSIGYSNGYCTTWDMFRFRPGAVKTMDDFATATRILSAGPSTTSGDQVFWDGLQEYEVSTGNSNGTGGDTRQASHWRDDALRSTVPADQRKIGIMDPTVGTGEIVKISRADLRLLAIIGWNIDFGNISTQVTDLKATSDFSTPNSVKLSWTYPEAFYDGRMIENTEMKVLQNGNPVHTVPSFIPGDTGSVTIWGLDQGKKYEFRILPTHTSGDTGISASIWKYAGGSLIPDAGNSLTAVNNGTTTILTIKTPVLHEDGTKLHNLNGYRIYRVRDKAVIKGTLFPSDTAKVITLFDTAPIGSSFATRYEVSFTGAGLDSAGKAVSTDAQKLGTSVTSLGESFDTGVPYKVVGTTGWKVGKESFMSSNAIGVNPVSAGKTETAYLVAVKPSANQGISFNTIARLDPAVSSGTVELSSDAGKTWTPVLTLNWNSNGDWASGQNTWVKETVSLADYSGKPVVLRFTLVSTGAGTADQAWYLDDFTLGTLTGVNDSEIISSLTLEPNYPNPFNPSTVIGFTLPVQSKVTVKVLNILGQEITTLVDGIRPAGHHEVTFSATGLPSGLYFCRMTSAGQSFTRKMILSK